jgi:predicted metalloprotease
LSEINWDNLSWDYWGNLTGSDTQPTEPEQDPTATEAAPAEPLTLGEIFALAEADINDYWAGVFADEGQDYSKPDIVLYNKTKIKTRCGTAPADIGPFYCGKDNTAYFPRDFMEDQHDRIGDYSVVVVIAHEWGHSIQEQLEYDGISIQRELQADCYAGAYSRYAVNDSEKVIIEDGDIDEATDSLFEAGDGGGSWFERNAHGSGDQRQAAFNTGLENGFGDC